LKDLDIQVDAAIIKQKAVDAGLVKSAEAYDALTAAQKQQIEVASIILLINQNVATSQEDLALMNGSLTQTTSELNATWENFTTSGGEVLKPLLIGLMTMLILFIQVWIGGLKLIGIGFAEFVSGLVGGFAIIDEALKGNIKSLDDVKKAFDNAYKGQRQTMYDMLFPGGLSPLQIGTKATGVASFDIGKKLGVPSSMATDTATAPKKIGGDEESNQNLLDAEKKFNQEILDAQLKLGQDLEDAAIDYERKRYDIGVDYATKVADINRSYSNTIADINQRQQEEKAKQRNDEMQKEREFQNQLLVLKENFLMALDDALHARDARQILKLIKNYELDKSQAERKNALDKKNAAEDSALRQKSFNEDRKKAEADRQAKLAEAQRDYADKLAKLKADEDAEREAARVANERKIADLNRELQNRLEVIAAGLVEEFKLTEANLQNIVNLYKKYYNGDATILSTHWPTTRWWKSSIIQSYKWQASRPV
jgi:hypothetical protein